MGKVGTEKTLQEILACLNDVRSDVSVMSGGIADNWDAVWKIVQAGKAAAQLPVGTQIIDPWALSDNEQDQYDAAWDVVHHYADGSVALNWHYAIPNDMMFDNAEAIYYAPTEGLNAGQYYIAVGCTYGNGWKTDQNINFTLTEALDAGDQIYIDFGGDNNINPTANRNWYVYAKGGTEAKQSGKTSNGTGGTNLGTIGATNAFKTEGNLNAISRTIYGSGRWSESAIRQWLNSAEAAGSWWSPQNGWDRPPAQAATVRGFLAGCSDDFLKILKPVPVITALNTQGDYTEATETTEDRIFLPALDSMYINPQYSGEDDNWDYYKTLAEEAGLSGKFKTGSSNIYEVLKKYSISAKLLPVNVWLRSAYRGTASTAWNIGAAGYVNDLSARYARRACPACKILKSS